MIKQLLLMGALALLASFNAQAGVPQDYVRAKYGKNDLPLASKKPSQMVPAEIAYLQEMGWRWDPVRKVWWGGKYPELVSVSWTRDAVLIPMRAPIEDRSTGPHWLYTEDMGYFRAEDENGEVHIIRYICKRYDLRRHVQQMQLVDGRWINF